MKPLSDYGIMYLGSIINDSAIAKLGIQVAQKQSDNALSRRMTELSYSHLNSKEYYLKSYIKLHHLLINIKNKPSAQQKLIVNDIERTALTFITMSKNSLDLLICILDILENKIIRREEHLPDLYTKYTPKNSDVFNIIEIIRRTDWVFSLKECRNRILHRGYSIGIIKNNITSDFGISLTKTELVFTEPESNTVVGIGVELMENNIIDIEKITQGLLYDLCKWEYEIANYFVNENIIGITNSQSQNWINWSPRLISDY